MSFNPPTFSRGQLEKLAQVLGDTEKGLTGSEIGQILRQAGLPDTDPNMTKWKRLFNAFVHKQNEEQSGNSILNFIHHALEPARYQDNKEIFEYRRRGVNGVLSYHGLEFQEDGKFHKTKKAETLSEAQERANRLRSELDQRNVHKDVIEYCRAELLEENCFHAVLEATKSVAEKIRDRTGIDRDGSPLVQDALCGNNPVLKINDFNSQSERSEQKGFANLLKGLFGTFRNPTAHEPRQEWNMSEEEALDLFTLASYAHKRLDNSQT